MLYKKKKLCGAAHHLIFSFTLGDKLSHQVRAMPIQVCRS